MSAPGKPDWNNLLLTLFSIVMVACYLTMGVIVLTASWFSQSIPANYRYALGIMLIVYGLFRGWRIYSTSKENNEQ